MDSVSHSCFSYLVCRASGAAPTPRLGLIAAGVALLPDLDFLLIPFLPETTRFAFHRGPSHSLFISIVMGIVLGSLTYRWLHLSWRRASLLIGLAWFSHILLDMCTGFGVALWWPVSHARTSADLLFVVDPLASLPLIVAVVWDIRANRDRFIGQVKIATVGLLVWGIYACISFGIRTKVTKDFQKTLHRHGYLTQEIHSEPTPFNNQLWYLCAKTEDRFIITYRSIWDGAQWEKWRKLPRNQPPLSTFATSPLLDKMKVVLEDWFTCRVLDNTQLDVIDMRLGKRYGWEDDNAPFLFIYQLRKTESGTIDWSMNKPGSHYNYGRLKGLFGRVGGKIPDTRVQPHPLGEGFKPMEHP